MPGNFVVVQLDSIGRVLLGLFRNRITRNRRYQDGICVLLGAIPFSK